ncbi:hypothetical protein FHW88_006164, partial [Mucilaginibacter sp. SG538B]|nr:hypothetical protein [Mucilaginibacter sp. SG538B]
MCIAFSALTGASLECRVALWLTCNFSNYQSIIPPKQILRVDLSCPEIGLHISKQKWKDIQKCMGVNGRASTV